MPTIETPRLILRSFTLGDWRPLKELIIGFSASPYAVYDHPWPHADRKIKDVCRRFAANEGFWAVCLKGSRDFIGYICLTPEQAPGVFNLGYCFHSPYQGRGYAYESCGALVEHAFQTLLAEKIISGTASENIPSCALLNKLGFR
jgi:RimJ/RimL family protein N-acetyltransferase